MWSYSSCESGSPPRTTDGRASTSRLARRATPRTLAGLGECTHSLPVSCHLTDRPLRLGQRGRACPHRGARAVYGQRGRPLCHHGPLLPAPLREYPEEAPLPPGGARPRACTVQHVPRREGRRSLRHPARPCVASGLSSAPGGEPLVTPCGGQRGSVAHGERGREELPLPPPHPGSRWRWPQLFRVRHRLLSTVQTVPSESLCHPPAGRGRGQVPSADGRGGVVGSAALRLNSLLEPGLVTLTLVPLASRARET